jgi:hypothetical protein
MSVHTTQGGESSRLRRGPRARNWSQECGALCFACGWEYAELQQVALQACWSMVFTNLHKITNNYNYNSIIICYFVYFLLLHSKCVGREEGGRDAQRKEMK